MIHCCFPEALKKKEEKPPFFSGSFGHHSNREKRAPTKSEFFDHKKERANKSSFTAALKAANY
jgi:hypothetical protein